MFTTGSKLFFGVTFIALAGAVVHGVVTGDLAGTIILASIAVVAAFLGGMSSYVRDADPRLTSEGVAGVPPAPLVSGSLWPLAGGLAATLMAVGLAYDRRVFGLGVVILLCTIAEWMLLSWSDRASADPSFNKAVRGRLAHPVEFPVIAALVVAALLFALSRIMLSLPEIGAIVIFSIVSIAILVVGTAIALRSRVGKSTLVGIGTLSVVALGAAAIVGVVRGEYHGEHHHEEANKAVAAKANPFASVVATTSGLTVETDGTKIERIVVPKSLASSVLFHNETGGKAKLVVESVEVQTDETGQVKAVNRPYETEEIESGKVKYLTFVIPKSGVYKMLVEGESGVIAEREIEVLS